MILLNYTAQIYRAVLREFFLSLSESGRAAIASPASASYAHAGRAYVLPGSDFDSVLGRFA